MKLSLLGFSRRLVAEARSGTVQLVRKERSDKVDPEVAAKVKAFYKDEKNSKILPGIRDVKSVKTDEGRVTMRKQFLLSTIEEAYLQFIEENGRIISKEMFRKLRPPNVVLVGDAGTHKICMCILCENPKYLLTNSSIGHLDSVRALIPDTEPFTADSFVKQLMCESPEEECFLSECDQCKERCKILQQKLKDVLNDEDIEFVEYTQWRVEQGSHFVNLNVSLENFCEAFVKSMSDFKTHKFLHKKQSTYLYQLKKDPPEGTLLCYMDYAGKLLN